jgi:hypothetical protein
LNFIFFYKQNFKLLGLCLFPKGVVPHVVLTSFDFLAQTPSLCPTTNRTAASIPAAEFFPTLQVSRRQSELAMENPMKGQNRTCFHFRAPKFNALF